MPKVAVYSVKTEDDKVEVEQVDQMELSDAVWAAPLHQHAIYETVRMQLANRRQGTAATKKRSEVRGGGRKPWRQKGTGRARQGSIRSPQWVGGGVVFGPQPRNYEYKVPKKVKRLALRSTLSSKLAQNELIVLESLNFEGPKTKRMISLLEKLDAKSKPILILQEANDNVQKSVRNIPGALCLTTHQINVYDLLNHGQLVITRDAVERLEEVLS
jgi:large subunit ribosomal protein L4